MIVTLFTISAFCILLVSSRRSILEYAGVLWLSIDINKCVAGAHEAFKDSNRSTVVIQMIKSAIDSILVIGIGRMLDRTGRMPFKISIAVLVVTNSVCIYYNYLLLDYDTTISIPCTSDR
jgi:hypothetical protein